MIPENANSPLIINLHDYREQTGKTLIAVSIVRGLLLGGYTAQYIVGTQEKAREILRRHRLPRESVDWWCVRFLASPVRPRTVVLDGYTDFRLKEEGDPVEIMKQRMNSLFYPCQIIAIP